MRRPFDVLAHKIVSLSAVVLELSSWMVRVYLSYIAQKQGTVWLAQHIRYVAFNVDGHVPTLRDKRVSCSKSNIYSLDPEQIQLDQITYRHHKLMKIY